MAQEYLICDKQELIAIADAVRVKTGNTDTYTVSELPDAIETIEAGGGIEIETSTVEIIPPANSRNLRYLGIMFNTLENKKIIKNDISGMELEEGNHMVMENVICGSFILFDHSMTLDYNVFVDGEEDVWYDSMLYVASIPYKNNEIVTIELQNA